jgi:lipid II:glycine glycyltransferase (peptidoglycan interpeptide bridge formation enzyme)
VGKRVPEFEFSSFDWERSNWDQVIADLPDPHFLQTREWAQVKAQFGWQPFAFTWKDRSGAVRATAMVLQRSIATGIPAAHICMMYVPKGPLLDWSNQGLRTQVLADLAEIARSNGAFFLKFDADIVIATGIPGDPKQGVNPRGLDIQRELEEQGWFFSKDQIQFRNTVLIDLGYSQEELLNRMKQKTRYNIRLAQRKGVIVREGSQSDLDLLYRMYAETAVRDNFVIRPPNYYLTVWSLFIKSGMAEALIAEVEGEPVAALIVFFFGSRAWYVYGMSRADHREKMPNHLLQWEAIQRSKQRGCRVYDLWGAPDDFSEQDPMWGVFRFKEGLGGQVIRTIGAWDFATNPFLYRSYTRILPRLLDLMRKRGKQKTAKMVQDHS